MIKNKMIDVDQLKAKLAEEKETCLLCFSGKDEVNGQMAVKWVFRCIEHAVEDMENVVR